MELAERALLDGETDKISDETVQRLLTAGTKLFANKVEMEDRFFSPYTTADDVTRDRCCRDMLRYAASCEPFHIRPSNVVSTTAFKRGLIQKQLFNQIPRSEKMDSGMEPVKEGIGQRNYNLYGFPGRSRKGKAAGG